MSVKIRLKRIGKKKKPFYRIIVANSKASRNGKFIKEIGIYDPKQNPSVYKIDKKLAKKWLLNGAKPTKIVKSLFKIAKI